jgi:hypothetical protein
MRLDKLVDVLKATYFGRNNVTIFRRHDARVQVHKESCRWSSSVHSTCAGSYTWEIVLTSVTGPRYTSVYALDVMQEDYGHPQPQAIS